MDQETAAMWPLACCLKDDHGIRGGQESPWALSHKALPGAKRHQPKKATYVKLDAQDLSE